MRALVAVLILAAAVGGFLLGRLTAPEAGGLRGRRHVRTAPPVTEPGASPPGPSVSAERTPEADASEVRASTEGVVQPAGSIEAAADEMVAADDEGEIEVDFDGFDGDHRAWAAARDIHGGYEVDDLEPQGEERGSVSPPPAATACGPASSTGIGAAASST